MNATWCMGFPTGDEQALGGGVLELGRSVVPVVHLQPGQDVQIGKYRLTYHPFPGTV